MRCWKKLLCIMNLYNVWVSLFYLNIWNKSTFEMYSNLLRYTFSFWIFTVCCRIMQCYIKDKDHSKCAKYILQILSSGFVCIVWITMSMQLKCNRNYLYHAPVQTWVQVTGTYTCLCTVSKSIISVLIHCGILTIYCVMQD